MVQDVALQRTAAGLGLHVVNVLWEDCARYAGSCVGPNISDVTLQIQHAVPGSQHLALTLLPVLRPPNFSDRTADLPLEQIFLLCGNQVGRDLELVSLRELLGDLRRFLSRPGSVLRWKECAAGMPSSSAPPPAWAASWPTSPRAPSCWGAATRATAPRALMRRSIPSPSPPTPSGASP